MSLKGAGNGLLSSLTVYELLLRGAEVEPNSPAITYIEDADTLSTVRLTRGQFITRLHQMIRLFRAGSSLPGEQKTSSSVADTTSIRPLSRKLPENTQA